MDLSRRAAAVELFDSYSSTPGEDLGSGFRHPGPPPDHQGWIL